MVAAEGVAANVDSRPGEAESRTRSRRLVPPAVTPVRFRDVAAAGVAHARGDGLAAFRRTVLDRLDGIAAATYTSYRRALGTCLRRLAETAPDRSTVLVPAFCSSDYPDAVEGVGLTLERYEVDPETLAMDLEAVRRRLDEDALALVTVSVLGYGSPMDEVADLCADRDVALVEALGYSFGATYRGRTVGSFGDCAVLNFQEGKPIPVGGGMIVARDDALEVSDEGRPSVAPNLGAVAGYAAFARPRLYYGYDRVKAVLDDLDVISDRVTTHPGSKRGVGYDGPQETMSNFQGALARRVLDRLPTHRRHRARTARRYADALESCEGVRPCRPVDGWGNHQHVRFPLRAASEDLRDEIVAALQDRGVQAGPMYGWPVIDGDAYPGAAALQDHLLALPTHPYVSRGDREAILATIRTVTADARR